jgi:hypothetical protein
MGGCSKKKLLCPYYMQHVLGLTPANYLPWENISILCSANR